MSAKNSKRKLKMDAYSIHRRELYKNRSPEEKETFNAKRRKLYAENPEYFKTFCRKWNEKNPGYRKEWMKEYNKTYPNEKKNRHRINGIEDARHLATVETELAKHCELCSPEDSRIAEERHHPNYDYPLIFISVCRSCHKYAHYSQQPPDCNIIQVHIPKKEKTE